MTDDPFSDKLWRLNNLYRIVDKQGRSIPFKMNPVQQIVAEDSHKRKLCLKARQLGMSTYAVLDLLDDVLFNAHHAGGIVSYSLEHAQHIYKRIIGHALETLHTSLKPLVGIQTQSAREITFANGSYLRVDTSLRGGSYQSVLVSEFGKTCARSPQKAEEVITGTLEAVPQGGKVVIESTAEGREGYFYDMCTQAEKLKKSGSELTELDFNFHFFPWHSQSAYSIKDSSYVLTIDQEQYFESLKELGIDLSYEQKVWYAKKSETLGEDMKSEYPSTSSECFTASTEGKFYAKQMGRVYAEKRICSVPWEESLEVHTSWDLGYSDSTSIWFFQLVGKEIRLIEHFQASGEPLTYYLKVLKEKPYVYGKHLVPHDAQVREYSTGLTRVESARKMGVVFTPVPKLSIHEGIDAVRSLLGKCWFDERKCASGIKALESYTKEWNQSIGAYSDSPRHCEYSHPSDSFRYLAIGLAAVVGRTSMTEDDASKYERLYK